MGNMKVIVDNADDILYKSFYVYGLGELFGKNAVVFYSRPFAELTKRARKTKTMRFLLKRAGASRR